MQKDFEPPNFYEKKQTEKTTNLQTHVMPYGETMESSEDMLISPRGKPRVIENHSQQEDW